MSQFINSTAELLEKIKSSHKNAPYDFIYISYGSKINETHVQIGSSCIPTNSHLQIIPNFLEARDESTKILSISIDDYSNDETKTLNKIQSYITPNMDVLLFNNAEISIQEITHSLVQYFNEIDFDPKNIMFCNFIRYIRPNKIECKIEEDVPNLIYNIICEASSQKYAECFYQWFGYNIYTYNLVFKYIMRDPIDVMYSRILNLFSAQFGVNRPPLSNDDFAELCHINTKSPLKLFLNSCVDISSYWKNSHKIKESIYELWIQVDEFSF
jgi:hypothetical protein